jgi:hypothetical protein
MTATIIDGGTAAYIIRGMFYGTALKKLKAFWTNIPAQHRDDHDVRR